MSAPKDVPLGDAAARDLITGTDPDGLGRTLFVEAGAGSGKTTSLVGRIVALVSSGEVELRHVAAITFTEKAAAELRDRVRSRIEEELRQSSGEDPALVARLRTALDQVDIAAISTLHAFAQRILNEHPLEAGLPPDVEVLDEVASELQFEARWRDFQRTLLDDDELAEVILLADAAGVKLKHLRDLALEFDRNWDLVAEPGRVPWPASGLPVPDLGPVIVAAQELADRREECTDQGDKLYIAICEEVLPYLDALEAAEGDAAASFAVLSMDKPTFKYGHIGSKDRWPDKPAVVEAGVALAAARDEARGEAIDGLLGRLAVTARDFVVDLGRRRVAAGRLEFHDLLVLARDLLRSERGPTVRAALRTRYRRLLLDEFQDTDPIQIQIAVLLATSDDDPADDWEEVSTDDGRLFFVGDPKQSIYRFRRADIALFLQAREVFGVPEPVRLSTNFRTSPAILDWVNHVFGVVVQPVRDSQPEYQPLDAAPDRGDPPVGPPVLLLGGEEHEGAPNAEQLREAEAIEVADTVARAMSEHWQVSERPPDVDGETWRDCRLGDITILLPARTSLPALERALESREIPYRAETSSLVYSTPEVRDLLLTVRALSDVTDQLALVAALRSPLFGCGDDDLVRFRLEHRGWLTLGADQPDSVSADDPVALALAELRALHLQAHWLAPSALLDRLCRQTRLFELGFASGRPRDLWRRLRFVIDHARAWEESEGGTLREYVEWARFQASESARVAESVLPETDDDAVRIMTIHGAKGLEFPITIVSGMSTLPGGRKQGVQVIWPRQGAVQIKAGTNIQSRAFEDFKPLDEQMDHHERIRLLYVACTRARDHLVVSLHRRDRGKSDGDAKCTSAELLAWGAREAPGAVTHERPDPAQDRVVGGPPGQVLTTAVPARAEWEAERTRALEGSARRRSLGATAVQHLLDEARDAGDEKDPLDLELPAWRKGRYGTAIGRAVHAVLQTIDLATGEGVDQATSAQAAAEGVTGREADIAALVRAALGSPVVREAAAASERWRETYVATTIGDTVLEGYLDLLHRDGDGRLVVTDYKTAASADDLDTRTAHYRGQAGAYALAVERAAGEPVHRVVLVYLTPEGAIERDVEDLDGARQDVLSLLQGAT